MDRASLVTVLWRAEGAPNAGSGTAFTDLTQGWYLEAVSWAREHGIVEGVSLTQFAPDAPLTREQMVTILYRYAAHRGSSVGSRADLRRFIDGGSVSGFASGPMAWAVAEGLLFGRDGGRLDPQGKATRAEIAAVFARFAAQIGI